MNREVSGVNNPRRPRNVSSFADACLRAIDSQGYSSKISLGGAFALACFFEYRETHDIDAWWEPDVTSREREMILECLKAVLNAFGEVHSRAWGDVASVELSIAGGAVFSFQIASRDARLEPPVRVAGMGNLQVDSFRDLVAAKMKALVERGAPRDFRDIHALCEAQRIDPRSCWDLWRQRQKLAQGDTSSARARLAVETHLARIETLRPLEAIADAAQRTRAQSLRAWFRGEFLNALMD
jgi:hypothetical protein